MASGLTSEQQEPLDDMIKVGLMSIGQALYEMQQNVEALIRDIDEAK